MITSRNKDERSRECVKELARLRTVRNLWNKTAGDIEYIAWLWLGRLCHKTCKVA